MIDKFLSERMEKAHMLIEELSKTYSYVSILGNRTIIRLLKSSTSANIIQQSDDDCGFVIKMYDGKGYKEFSCDDIENVSAKDIVTAVTLSNLNQERVNVKALKDEPISENFERKDLKPISDQLLMKRLTAIKDRGHEVDSRIVDMDVSFIKRHVQKFFMSKNRKLTQNYEYGMCYVFPVIREGDTVKNNYFVCYGTDTEDIINEVDSKIDSEIKLVAKLLDAKTVKPGVYDVITDPSITGLIAHEAFGHGVEMDMFVKNRAKAKDFIGKRVASPLINMYDGAYPIVSNGSFFFDDDGIISHNTQIIKDGILQSGISDSLSALQLGMEPTGNGRRESYKRKMYTRMTNTYFGAGESNLDDMIKSIEHGYYIVGTNNGMEDPKNWQIQCTAQYGLEIKNGKFTGEIVSPVIISGYVLDVLNSISMVSKEFKIIGAGSCGKGYKEWVPVSDGGPYLKAKVKLG